MGRGALKSLSLLLLIRWVGQSYSPEFLMVCEIDNSEAVKVGKLDDDLLSGPVGIAGERHRANPGTHGKSPGDVVGRRVDHADSAGVDRPRDRILSVGSHVHVVDGS